jgi:hypothetical protein
MGLIEHGRGLGGSLKCEKPDPWRGRAFQKGWFKAFGEAENRVVSSLHPGADSQTRTISKSMLDRFQTRLQAFFLEKRHASFVGKREWLRPRPIQLP